MAIDRIASIAALLAACLLVAGVATPALAGDNVALFFFDDEELEADPGETVTVDVVLRAHGGYGGEGVGDVEFAVEYDPDVLSVTGIERGPWLETDGDDETGTTIETVTEIDDERGSAWIEQTREPYGDGATGDAVVATVTLEVSEDAEPTTATLEIAGSAVTLVNDVQQSTMTREATVVIDGGGDEEPTGDERAGDEDDGPEGVTLADDADESDDAANASDDADAGSDTLTGFGTLAAVAGLVTAALLARAAGRRR